MPTKNVVVNSSWTKVAEASEDGVFVSWEYPVALEVAVTATDTAPAGTITGHIFNREAQVTRATVGAGFMWVRTVSGSTPAELSLAVSNSAAASGGGGGGASAAEISAALTATNANMEASLQDIDAQTQALSSTVVNGKVLVGGARDKWRDSFESLNPANWDFDTARAPNDAVTLAGDTQGASFMEICLSAFAAATSSEVRGLRTFAAPYRLGFGASMSQRAYGEAVIISVAAVDETGNRITAPGETESFFGPSLTVKKIIVTSNVATVIFDQPHGLKFDDIVVISDAADNRMNVQGRVTSVRSRYAVTMPLTFANGNYLPGANCKLNRFDPSKGSANVAGMLLMDTTDSNGIYFSRGQGSPNFLSGVTNFGTSYTTAQTPSSQPFSVNLQPRFMTELVGTMDVQRWISSAIDSLSVGIAVKRSQNVPDPLENYAMFFDVVALPNRAVPIEILSVVKTGTTTATVTTVNPHGLATGAYVYGYGARNQTTLPNLTTAVAVTVTGPSTLTMVWGTAVTETTYGGMLVSQNGGTSVPGALNTAVMGTAWYNGRLYVSSSSTAPFTVGDVVRFVGVKDVTGTARPNMSGRFRVVAINPNVQEAGILTGASTTSGSPVISMTETGAVPFGGFLTGTGLAANSNVSAINPGVSITVGVNTTATNTQLQDITLAGVVLEPIDFVAPANAQPMTLISAGAIFKETTLRTSFARCLDYTRTPVEVTGGHYTGDSQQGLTSYSMGGSIGATQGAAASIATGGVGAWIVRGAAHATTDIASAAYTTVGSTASSAVDVSANTGSMHFNVDATAASGTAPRLITRVQGALDASANFVNIYDVGVVTGFGATAKNHDTPVIPVEFRAIRYVRDLRGTTPSITHSVTRVVRPMEISRRQRRLIDRVVGLATTTPSTEWLYVGGCDRAQMMCTPVTGLTGAPVLKAQLCQGDPSVAGNWYDIPGAPTLAPSLTMSVATAAFEIGTAKFMRFVPTTAATAATADTYELVMTAWE